MKEMFIEAHEQLIGEYLEAHPEATEAEAYDKTADKAYDKMTDKLCDLADRLHDEMKGDKINVLLRIG